MTLTASRAHGQSVEGFPPAQSARAQHAAQVALQLATDWLGPPPFTRLTVRGVTSLPQPPSAGVFEVPVRWLTVERDRSLERTVIAGVVRQFWLRSAPPGRFEEGLAAYTATRAIHELLEGSNFATVRFFGGFVPLPLRSVLLSPPVADPRPRVWRFEEVPADEDVLRMVRGLQTLERYVGWPAMAQALAAMRAGNRNPIALDDFAATLSVTRGADLTKLVDELFRAGAGFDYAIENVAVRAVGGGLFETTLTVIRRGSGVFAAVTDGDREPNLPLLLRFADGTELRDWSDGAASSSALTYTAKTPLVYAVIDPEITLLLDENRANNTFATALPRKPLAIRLALHWMSWLQQTMLACAALV